MSNLEKKYSLWLVTKAYSLLIGTALLSLSLILGHSFLSQKDIESISLHLAAPQIAPTAKALPFACPNSWPLRRGLVMYNVGGALPQSTLNYIAPRFEITVKGHPTDISYLTQNHPGFIATYYNSLSDMYAPTPNNTFHPEHDWLFAHAAEYGLDPEDIYLHFWKDTTVTLQGQTGILIPGWQPDSPKPGASATSRDQARIPVYYADLSRRAKNYGDVSDSPLRRLHRAARVDSILQAISPGVYYSGVMFDNAAYYHLSVSLPRDAIGQPLLGGEVAEHPSHALVDSAEFNSWYFFNNEGAFMKELRLWAATNPPELAGRPFKVLANAAGVPAINQSDWERAYVDFHPADMIIQEFSYSPTRFSGQTLPATIYQKNLLAQQA